MEGVVLRGVKNSTALVLTSYMEKKLSCLVKLAYQEFSACIRKLEGHFTDSYTEVKPAERTARPSRLCFLFILFVSPGNLSPTRS